MNLSVGLPGGATTADYNRLFLSKVEFIKVDQLPTSNIKEYPYLYILMAGEAGIIYEYNGSSQTWIKYGSEADLGIIPITGAEYDALSEEQKNLDVFYLITDRIAYLEDVAEMKGATESKKGVTGTVPTPMAGDQNKFLRGDGVWASPEIVINNTLASGMTSISMINDNISDDSLIDVYTNNKDYYVKDMSVSGTTLTLTFNKAPSEDVKVKIIIRNI